MLAQYPNADIGAGRDGGLVVFVVGQKSGGDYDFKRGVQQAKILESKVAYPDAELAAIDFKEAAPAQSKLACVVEENDDSDADGDGADVGSNACESGDGREASDSDDDDGGCTVAASEASTLSMPGKRLSGASHPAASAAPGKRARQVAPTAQSEDSDDEDKCDSGSEAEAKVSKRSAVATCLKLALKLEKMVEDKHSAEKQHSKHIRSRDHTRIVERLGKVGNKLMSFIGNDKALKQSERLFTLQALVDERMDFIIFARTNPCELHTIAADPVQIRMLGTFKKSTLANVYQTSVAQILMAEPEKWHVALTIARCRLDENDHAVTCHVFAAAARSTSDDLLMAATCQVNIIVQLAGALCKSLTPAQFATTIATMTQDKGLDLEDVDIAKLDVDNQHIPTSGWCAQALVDMKAMQVFAEYSNAVQTGQLVNARVRSQAKAILNMGHKLSTGIRSYCRIPSTQGKPNNFKSAWDAMKENCPTQFLEPEVVANKARSALSAMQAALDYVLATLERPDDMNDEDYIYKVYQDVVDVISDREGAVADFRNILCGDAAIEYREALKEDADCVQGVAEKFVSAFGPSVALVIKAPHVFIHCPLRVLWRGGQRRL